jgi:acyl-[acyl-carrier-protein]-phospholipid O-acyltransferase/long-chain-fatty-acid--[acyl-carrier-protein] ligase
MELAIMLSGTLALHIQNFAFQLAILFMMALQSTIFSPAKYSSLPELLPEWRLIQGKNFASTSSPS